MAADGDTLRPLAAGNICDLNGRLVRRNSLSTRGLPAGICIVNGRKQVVR